MRVYVAHDRVRTATCDAGSGAWQVHRGFLRAFQSVVANRLPGYTLDAVATNMTGVRPADMTLCAPVLWESACTPSSAGWCQDMPCMQHLVCVSTVYILIRTSHVEQREAGVVPVLARV